MKKLIPTLAVLLLSFSISAQYKKASFFGRQGRTYELGAQSYILGDGKGDPIGFKIGFGRDQDGKQFFTSWEIQFIPSYKYSYTTTSEDMYSSYPVKVEGKTKSALIYALNYSYYLLNNKNTERKIKPYVTAGTSVLLAGGIKTETVTPDPYYSIKKQSEWPDFTMGIGGGLGCIFSFTDKLGLKVQGGYEQLLRISSGSYGEETYYVYNSHPYVSLGLRLRIVSE